MQMSAWVMAGMSVMALSVAACSPKTEVPAATAPAPAPATAPMPDMPMSTTAPAVSGPITSTGKITAIDATSGTVTIDHQAIPEVKWDAMTMGFTATDPAMLKDLKVGDAVVFDLKSAEEPNKISRIAKQ